MTDSFRSGISRARYRPCAFWALLTACSDDAPSMQTPPSGVDAALNDPNDAGVAIRDSDGAAADARAADASNDGVTPDSQTAEAGDCPAELVGWATVAGDGVSTTTGGGSVAPVRPTTAAELTVLAADDTARVIEIAGSFDVPKLVIASNKTLIGIGQDATLRGGVSIRGSDAADVHNVIVRNLRVDGARTQADGDAVHVIYAHHVWIDHCEIWDGPDGNLDVTHAANWTTVSWTKIHYTESYKTPPGEANPHRFASLVGHSDENGTEDNGRLKVSFHHNHWAERVIERMPRVRFGQVHVFNNLFAAPDNNYCVRAGRGAQLLVEGNYFDGVNNPHVFNSDADEATAHITARANVYDQTQGEQASDGGGTPFTQAPYDVTIEPAESIPAIVRRCAGPR